MLAYNLNGDFNLVQNAISQQGSDVVIALDQLGGQANNDVINLQGVQAADLGANDFIL
ncbi:MAG: hypothetical protein GKR77_07710 [Legionellales bacterium]|nr:hypothetical protein [Legionellales bacterium]